MALAALAAALAAPALYVTHNYNLILRPPPGAYYCPLPKDWIGSDHGTILFLKRPESCGGAGYPSTSRGYAPEGLPRIWVFYGYDLLDDEKPPPKPCAMAGLVTLFGRVRPLCRTQENGETRLEARSTYGKGNPDMDVALTLVTRGPASRAQLASFRTLVASVTACRTDWKDDAGRVHTAGSGSRCPPNGRWF